MNTARLPHSQQAHIHIPMQERSRKNRKIPKYFILLGEFIKKALKSDLIQGKCENVDQGQCQKLDTIALPDIAGEKKYLPL